MLIIVHTQTNHILLRTGNGGQQAAVGQGQARGGIRLGGKFRGGAAIQLPDELVHVLGGEAQGSHGDYLLGIGGDDAHPLGTLVGIGDKLHGKDPFCAEISLFL